MHAGVITLELLGNFKLASPRRFAEEPELTNKAYFLSNNNAICFSNSLEYGPFPASHPSFTPLKI